jgi:hypothetical protein
MKTTVSLNRKIVTAAPPYGDLLIHCSCEVDLEPSNPEASAVKLCHATDICRMAIDREIELELKNSPKSKGAREPGEDDNGVREGDPAFHRQNRQANKPHQRKSNGPVRPSQHSGQQGGRQGSEQYGPPRNARQFLGWLGKQSEEVKEGCRELTEAWNLPTKMLNWSDQDWGDVYKTLIERMAPAAEQNGYSGNGRY